MSTKRTPDGMRKEYSLASGVRGRFAKDFPPDVVLVKLDPDVAEHFPDAKAVNAALRGVLQAMKDGRRRRNRSAA